MPRAPRPWYRKSRRMFYTTVNGVQHPLGVSDPKNVTQAHVNLDALLAQLQGSKPGDLSRVVVGAAAFTVGQAIDAYLLAKEPHVKPITLRNYARHLAHFRRDFEACHVATLDGGAVQARAKGRGWSDTNTANYLATVEACLRHAGRPISFRKPARESAGADSVIPEPVYRACLRESRGDFHQLLRFLWSTGCRPGEAANLTAEQVDVGDGVCRLREHKTRGKTGRPRLLYLSPEALSVTRDQLAKYTAGHLFRGVHGNPYSIQAVVMRFTRLSERVGHPVTAYGFRHSYATYALKAGVPDAQVAALMGHKNTTMIHRHYNHVAHDARLLRGVAASLDRAG